MVIDTHQHFWKIGQFDGPHFNDGSILNRDFLPEHIKPLMDSCAVQRTIVVQGQSSVDETRWLLQLAKKKAYIAGVVGWVDLTSPDVGRILDELQTDDRLRGVRHPAENEMDPDWLVREDVIRGLKEVARRELTYDLLVQPQHLIHALMLAERVPELRMVVDHIAKPSVIAGPGNHSIGGDRASEAWARDIEAVARIPSLYCKLSGMITESRSGDWKPSDFKPYIDVIINAFGHERVMFGSDWPVCLLAGSYIDAYQVVVQGLRPITPDTFSKVFGGNAQKFYGLGDMDYFISP